MCCFNSNIEELENQLKELETTTQGVVLGVEDDRRKARVIAANRGNWLNQANVATSEIKSIIQDKSKIKEGCLNGWCPNLKLRYSLSRKAVKKTEALVGLQAEGRTYTKSSFSPPPACLETIQNTEFEGYESRVLIMKEVIEALKHDEINLIGLWGMGGIGKTTMAKEVHKRAIEEKLFDEVGFVVVGQKPDVADVQKCIADSFGLKNQENLHPAARASLLRTRLQQDHKKILVILDDVWEYFNLYEMGIPLGANKNFKVLYSSRNQNLWVGEKTRKEIPLKLLSEQEAWELFREKAGKWADDLQPIAKQIVNECGRLPLALVIIGGALLMESEGANSANGIKHIWQDMHRRLICSSKSPEDERLRLFSKLELSYTDLKVEEAKRLFLLCCLFREDYDIRIEDLARFGLGLSLFKELNAMGDVRDRVFRLINDLKRRCLLLDGARDGHVKVHDVVRNMGISIACRGENGTLVSHGDPEWPKHVTYENYTSISIISEKMRELPKVVRCRNLELLLLGCRRVEQIPCYFFVGMEELKVLELTTIKFPAVQFLRKLRTLCLDHCYTIDDISGIGELLNLEVLSCQSCGIRELPDEMRKLTKLRLLDVTGCNELERIPPGVISHLVQLEELYMMYIKFIHWEGEGNEKGSNASLREFEPLSKLNTLEIMLPAYILLPKVSIFGKLIKYVVEVTDGSTLSRFIDMRQMRNTYEKILIVCTSSPIPLDHGENIVSLLWSADCLHLEGKGSENLVHEFHRGGFERLQQLKKLTICECDTPECLVNTMINLVHPQPYAAANAPAVFPILKELDLYKLPNLKVICNGPVPARSFGKLTDIKIDSCKSLTKLFPISVVGCPMQLESLSIEDCYEMEEVIWKDPKDDAHLAINKIEFPKLLSVELLGLRSVIGFCRGIDEINFPQLKSLELVSLPVLKCFCNLSSDSKENHDPGLLIPLLPPKVALPSLKKLNICELNKVVSICGGELPNGPFPQLRELKVTSCGSLRYIFYLPKDGIRLPEFTVEGVLQQLKKLTIRRCDALEYLVNTMNLVRPHGAIAPAVCPILEELNLYELPNLKEIWPGPVLAMSFGKLIDIEINSCGSLTKLIPISVGGCFMQLKSLSIEKCDEMEEVIWKDPKDDAHLAINKIKFPKLLSVKLTVLRRLIGLCKGIDEIDFPQLESLELAFLPELKCVCNLASSDSEENHDPGLLNPLLPPKVALPSVLQVALPSLKKLYLRGLNNVVRICCGEHPNGPNGPFPQLSELEVELCGSLRYIFYLPKDGIWFPEFTVEGVLQQLKKLTIRHCDALECLVNTMNLVRPHGAIAPAVCPILEELNLLALPNLKEIWPGPVPAMSFGKVIDIKINSCGSLTKLFPISVGGCLMQLKSLSIEECDEMEEVIWKDPKDDARLAINKIEFPKLLSVKLTVLRRLISLCRGIDEIDFPQLESLHLGGMPELKCVFHNKSKLLSSDSEENHDPGFLPLLPPKVALPSLKRLLLHGLDNAVSIWCGELPNDPFPQLERLSVKSCGSLRNIFYLPKGGIRFPKFTMLNLVDLPRLGSFFHANRPLGFPLLEHVQIRKCPEMETFSLGDVSTPRLGWVIEGDQSFVLKDDLNSTVKLLHDANKSRRTNERQEAIELPNQLYTRSGSSFYLTASEGEEED